MSNLDKIIKEQKQNLRKAHLKSIGIIPLFNKDGGLIVPEGTLDVSDKCINLMAKSLSLIIRYEDESLKALIIQNISLFNRLICSNGIEVGTKRYKAI